MERNTVSKESLEFAPMKESKSQSISVHEHEKIGDSPFNIITTVINNDGVEEREYRLTIGNVIITEAKEKEELVRMVNKPDWNLIIAAVCFIIEKNYKIKTEN